MLKKTLIIMTILVLCLSFSLVPAQKICYAEEDNSQGYNLEGNYMAEIVFGNFNLKNGGIVRSFMVTIDKDFYFPTIDQGIFESVLGRVEMINFITQFMTEIGYEPEVDNLGRVIGSVSYDSYTDLYLDYGIDGYEKDDSDYAEDTSFFYNDVTIRQTTVFDGIEVKDSSALNVLLEGLYYYGITREQVALSYHYGTPYKIISTDAERSYLDTSAEIYIHEFNMNLDTSGREIVIVQHSPNATGWYILAIGVSLIVVMVSVGFALLSIRRKNRRR